MREASENHTSTLFALVASHRGNIHFVRHLFAYLDACFLHLVLRLRIKASELDASCESFVVVSSLGDFASPKLCSGVGRAGSLGFLEVTGLGVGGIFAFDD